jgi:hypothetical protein
MLETYVCEWQLYKENIEQLLIGGLKNEQIWVFNSAQKEFIKIT